MYKQVLIPDKKNHSIELPEDFYGKKIEVTVKIVKEGLMLAKNEKVNSFLDDIEPIPDFPSIDDIRKEAWPDRW